MTRLELDRIELDKRSWLRACARSVEVAVAAAVRAPARMGPIDPRGARRAARRPHLIGLRAVV